MARDISELGADVYDDTVVAKKGKLSPKKRNYVIGLSCTGVAVLGLVFVYIMMAKVWFIDLNNIEYLTVSYPVEPINGKVTCTVDRINLDADYPENFRIPQKINGYPVTRIADGAFKGAKKLKSVDLSSIESIGAEAFDGCENLEKFSFSDNVHEIGTNAFRSTKYIANLPQDELTIIGDILLYAGPNYFEPNTIVLADHDSEIPAKYQSNSYIVKYFSDFSDNEVSIWPDGAFYDNDNLIYFQVPSYVNSMTVSLFENCDNLEGVDFSLTSFDFVSKKALFNCTSLVDVKLPQTINSIGESAFYNTKISTPIGLDLASEIGESAYKKCTYITDVTYPAHLTSIPKYLFSDCSNLVSFEFANPENITRIEAGAFSKTGLSSFRIPKKVELINDQLFAECKNLTYVELYENVNDVIFEGSDIPDEGDDLATFISYDGKTIKNGIPLGLKKINGEAFSKCDNFDSIKLYGDDGNLISGKDTTGDINLPYTLTNTNSSTINSTGSNNFVGTKLVNVKFGPNARNISEYCFDGVSTLKTVEFGTYFDGTTSLSTIYKYAFRKTGIESITIPNSVGKIGIQAFANCKSLTSVVLPEPQEGNESVFAIENGTFRGCENLSSINLPKNLSKIASGAFEGVKGISEFDIPLSCVTLEEASFVDMSDSDTKVVVNLPWTEEEVKAGKYINDSGLPIQLFVSLDDDGNVNFCDDTVQVNYKVA